MRSEEGTKFCTRTACWIGKFHWCCGWARLASSRAIFSADVSGLPGGVLGLLIGAAVDPGAECLDQVGQRASGDPKVVGDAPQRGSREGLV